MLTVQMIDEKIETIDCRIGELVALTKLKPSWKQRNWNLEKSLRWQKAELLEMRIVAQRK